MTRTLPAAQAVCAQHWKPLGAQCHRCPIHAECTSGVTPLTEETLQAWRNRCNEAAERVLQAAGPAADTC